MPLKPPNPGSLQALALGCKCPQGDNDFGRGSFYGKGLYLIREDCPLHVVGANLTPLGQVKLRRMVTPIDRGR